MTAMRPLNHVPAPGARRLLRQAGQAMTEYALMSMAIMAASVFLFERLMTAYQIYTKGFYILLTMPFP